jgi:hypothetical protein
MGNFIFETINLRAYYIFLCTRPNIISCCPSWGVNWKMKFKICLYMSIEKDRTELKKQTNPNQTRKRKTSFETLLRVFRITTYLVGMSTTCNLAQLYDAICGKILISGTVFPSRIGYEFTLTWQIHNFMKIVLICREIYKLHTGGSRIFIKGE